MGLNYANMCCKQMCQGAQSAGDIHTLPLHHQRHHSCHHRLYKFGFKKMSNILDSAPDAWSAPILNGEGPDVSFSFQGCSTIPDLTVAELSESELTSDDIRSLPSNQRNCVVCLQDYEPSDSITTLPCLHRFHTGCIEQYVYWGDAYIVQFELFFLMFDLIGALFDE